MKIGKYQLTRNDNQFYTSRDGEFSPPYDDDKPTLVIEKHFESWRARVFTDKWCEHCVMQTEGSFKLCVYEMREYFSL